ncbi:kinesin motor domain protein [Fusarium subglutinans]|uniref:Kinesin motor domain protein n=1 Tax=Gibberella subglutinans TaxID=42677 RepID=A0A8H5LDI5_GIBSU|nr:kinesin motor domain protein [Fusarium subglutinans]KAF5591000.1 kinesin motor domain protein [Fusarium subglutinans]
MQKWKDAHLESFAQPVDDQPLVHYTSSKTGSELPLITIHSAFDPASFLLRLARGHDLDIFGLQDRKNTSALVPAERRKALQSSEEQQEEVVEPESNGATLYKTAMKASMVNPGQVLIKDLRTRNDFKDKRMRYVVRPSRALYSISRQILTTYHLNSDKRRSGGDKVSSELTDATRALACLRTFTRCSLTDKPELMELFDQWLIYAAEKIGNESEKQKVMKAQLVAAKDEIKSQGVIVSGLLRERHSVHITPDDSALVLSLRETIEDMKKREASMSRQNERLRTKLADRKRTSYSTFPSSQKSIHSQDQSSSKHTASTHSLSPSDRFSYQSIPTSSTTVHSENERSQGYESESEQKHKSRQAAKERLS